MNRRPRLLRPGLAWQMLESHYRSRHAFQQVFREYENRVLRLAAERRTPREELRLNPAETTTLFETSRLEQLIQRRVVPLRDATHAFFRENQISDPYDSEISKIYHELSILKEEHLSVRDFPRDGGRRDFRRLFNEVSEYYPQRLRRVRDLFTRAQRRLDQILPRFATDQIVLRSAHLFRSELWPEQVQAGLNRFLARVFPDGGPARGYLQIARSFYEAGFLEEAAASAKEGVAFAARPRAPGPPDTTEIASRLQKLIELARKEIEEIREQLA